MAIYCGLMSGTSLDGVDGVLADLDDADLRPRAVLSHAHARFDPALKAELQALNTSGPDELHRAALAANELMTVYAAVFDRLLVSSNCSRAEVQALGAHGQTVRHRPQAFGGPGYTLQLANGAMLAELTGVTTVCDFRSTDLAAGGQGAPLVPAFHAAMWSQPGRDTAVLNVGGVANLSLLYGDGRVTGFDTGPGNLLMDHWCRRAFGIDFDAEGGLAATGRVQHRLLDALLAEPFFELLPPKSTGRDLFDGRWLDRRLAAADPCRDVDVLATLCELSAKSVADSLLRQTPGVARLHVCGGGARNRHLVARLQARLPAVAVQPTDALGLPCDQVEALAFAWLAARRCRKLPGSLPAVTGARSARVLGAVYCAPAFESR